MDWHGFELRVVIDRNGSAAATFEHPDGTKRVIEVQKPPTYRSRATSWDWSEGLQGEIGGPVTQIRAPVVDVA